MTYPLSPQAEGRTARGRGGVVATAHPAASKIGADILRQGGNAFDAAVAAAFALGVCEPNASSIGGGGFMTAHVAREQENVFVDFREVAPASANPDMWQVTDRTPAGVNPKHQGGASICIPGEVAGLCHILENFGTMKLEQVLAPVIALAETGVPLSEALSKDLDENREKLEHYAEANNPYLEPIQIGELLKNLPLANTLRKIAQEGAKAFYDSDLTDKMVDSINRWGGQVTREDFKNFKVNQQQPLQGSYRGYEILSSPPPSSGGTHVLEILNILEQFDVKKLGYHSSAHLHLLSEVMKMSFADRATHMGDPAFVKLPLEGLLSKDYAAHRASSYSPNQVLEPKSDNPFAFESCDTTHFSVADCYGNVVSITKTISAFFGSGVVPADTGIMLNCQMRGFTTEKNHKNSVCGGKKPLSSMSPTILLKDGKPVGALGTPGANRIISTVAQVISNLVDFDMTLTQAIDAPRCSNDVPNLFCYESRIPQEAVQPLVEMGQQTKQVGDWDRFVGGVQGVWYDPDDMILGSADVRRGGQALAVT